MASSVLVKVGSPGKDSLFKNPLIFYMDRMTLLVELSKSSGFSTKFKGVLLDECVVMVLRSQSQIPSEAEESAAVELICESTINDVIKDFSDSSKVFVRVRMPHELPEPVALEFRIAGRKGETTVTHTILSHSDFDKLISGSRLFHLREDIAVESLDLKTGKKKRTTQRHSPVLLDIITDLGSALVAQREAGTYLSLRDTSYALADDVSNLKGFRSNIARGFEEESNKAIAANELLLKTYGGSLELLNGGRGVAFIDIHSGQEYVQCDGLISSSTHVIVNEAKTHLHERDVEKLVDETAEKLKVALANPLLYTSNPACIMGQLAGRTLVHIFSCRGYSEEARILCTKRGVHLLESDGSGFKCTL